MSEFKFSCPNCRQNISATSEYSGAQINCPSCQTPLVVPADPNQAKAPAHQQTQAASDNPLVPSVPVHTKLTMAASTVVHQSAANPPALLAPIRKKKDKKGLYIGLACGGVAVVCLFVFWQPISDAGRSAFAKVHKEAAPVAVEPTNTPAPPPPELTTPEILQNVADAYKNMTNYSVRGLAAFNLDLSGVQPGGQKQVSTEAVSLELGRSNLYRLQWEMQANGMPFKGAAWSAGKGDFVGYGQFPATKSKSRQTALAMAGAASQAQCIALAHLFFDDTNSVSRLADAFAKTNGPGLATKINNHDCYVLDGQFEAHDLVLWIDKESFLVHQIQFVFGGNLDESTLKGRPPAEKAQVMMWSKLKGTITETYGAPDLEKNLTASAFEADFAPTFNMQVQQSGAGGGGRQRERGASPSSPTQLTRRVRDAAAAHNAQNQSAQ
jgi:hypothetical protein